MKFSNSWIGMPLEQRTPAAEAELVLFRRVIEKSSDAMPVNITADCRYKLYVNGRLVQFGPVKGDDKIWYEDSFDLAPFLTSGKNALCVLVLHYPENPGKGNLSLFRGTYAGFRMAGPDAVNDQKETETEGWHCRKVSGIRFCAEESVFAPLQIHEVVSADAELNGWMMPDYDDSKWLQAEPIPDSQLLPSRYPDNLVPRPVPFMNLLEHRFELPVQNIPAHSEQRFVLDAGEEMCAFLQLTLKGGRGAALELLECECYVTNEGKQNRLDAINGHLEGYRDTFVIPDDFINPDCTVPNLDAAPCELIYEPYWFRTFRFIEVSIRTADEPLEIESFLYRETGYPLDVKTFVRTSDPDLSGIWDISLRTLRRCMHETYMDCPFYEQLQYVMDTRAQALYTYAISGDDRLGRKAIDDFSRGQHEDGLMNCSYPNVSFHVIPGFSIYYILMLHDHMMYFGDAELIHQYLPVINRILDYFRSHLRDDGLVDKIGGINGKAPCWSYIDWSENWMQTEGMPTAGLYGPLTMESLLFLIGLQAAAELIDFLESSESEASASYHLAAERCRHEAEILKQSIRSACMNDDGMLTDGPGRPELSQHAQVFGILTGTLSIEEGRINLIRTFKDDYISKCSVAMSLYLFRALEKTGLYDYTERCWDRWRTMIADGCTTCIEGENYSRSECHAWGALALYELPAVILGVQPAAPGFEKIRIYPVPGTLSYAYGTVYTPKGEITVNWKKNGDAVDLQITAPESLKNRILHT